MIFYCVHWGSKYIEKFALMNLYQGPLISLIDFLICNYSHCLLVFISNKAAIIFIKFPLLYELVWSLE
uniref:Uncharacterized protein n=1 Tax=Arundo donax TaxID=35708 RepID=A0A0A8YH88_ARUDO